MACGLGLLGLTAACAPQAPEVRGREAIGLSSSLPLVWSESGDIRGQLAIDRPRHWVPAELERHGRLILLDTLAGPQAAMPLPSGALLVLIQPQALTPDENVALDAWVREGGRLLLFADPMLTAHSDFPLGDPRRPQAIAMLSPILRHWGLELAFDPDQPAGERQAEVFGVAVPVDLRGRFAGTAAAGCRFAEDRLAADCAIGKGRAIVVADAALFDGDDAGRAAAFRHLLALLTH